MLKKCVYGKGGQLLFAMSRCPIPSIFLPSLAPMTVVEGSHVNVEELRKGFDVFGPLA